MKPAKLYLPAVLVAALFLISCETISYLGDTYPVNQNVKIYYDVHDVKREYKVIGHITCAVYGNEEDAKNKIIGKAKMVGADAIVFNGLAYTGGKDSSPFEKADVLKFTGEQPAAKEN